MDLYITLPHSAMSMLPPSRTTQTASQNDKIHTANVSVRVSYSVIIVPIVSEREQQETVKKKHVT
jgi:hypothetical protein